MRLSRSLRSLANELCIIHIQVGVNVRFPTPPMIFYPKAFPGGAYTFRGPDNAVYAKSESG